MGLSLNRTKSQFRSLNGPSLNGPGLNGPGLSGPGLKGPATHESFQLKSRTQENLQQRFDLELYHNNEKQNHRLDYTLQ